LFTTNTNQFSKKLLVKNPIYPCLWFDGKAKDAATFYCEIFPNSKILSENPIVVNFELNGNKFMALNGGPTYQLTPANSYVIECENQEEIDHYWYKLGNEGVFNQCGWLEDKFGVSWQIVPTILGKLMSNPEKSQRVIAAFMKMKKFDIEALENA
jgi:predicted 3-demethylubiquinone-9 3-methyltransferase (glyoxalase superfamily)